MQKLLFSLLLTGLMLPLFAETTPIRFEAWNGAELKEEADGVITVTVKHPQEELRWGSFLIGKTSGRRIYPGAEIRVRFTARASRPQGIYLRVTEDAPRSTHYSETRNLRLTTEFQKYELLFTARAAGVGTINLPRLALPELRPGETIQFKAATVETPPSPAASPLPEVRTDQPGDWRILDHAKLYIRPGSALDLTTITDRNPAGSYGRLTVNSQGEAEFPGRPGMPVRFLTLQTVPSATLAMNKPEIDEYVAAAARQGYNMVRLHYLDRCLMQGNPANIVHFKTPPPFRLPQTPEEITFDAATLDRFHYLVSRFKAHGIYLNLDAMSSYTGYSGVAFAPGGGRGNENTKVRMFVDPLYRQNWIAGVGKLLAAVNPYTGLALKDDPALALVTFLNEQEILTNYRDYGAVFQPAWIRFLRERYRDDFEALRNAWGTSRPDGCVSFETAPPIAHDIVRGNTPPAADQARFIARLEEEMTGFYRHEIRAVGYDGLVTNWNMRTRLASVPARAMLSAVSMNTYHAHPDRGYDSPGTQVTPESALKLGGNSFKSLALARFADRPFFNTEFGIVFWNAFRHEQGLLFGAGAALQGWNALACHADPVAAAGSSLGPFITSADPAIRTSELVTAFAFLRGDVALSPHRVEVPLTAEWIFNGRALRGMDDELTRLWALTRVGILYGKPHPHPAPDLVIHPEGSSAIGGSDMYSKVENALSTSRITPTVERLKQRGILPAGNRTDPARGIYQSDTGELLLDTAKGELRVETPRLAGLVMKEDRRVELDGLTVESCTLPASLTLVSLDPKSTRREAGRLLLVFATDYLNNDMRFKAGTERRTLEKIGSMPIIARTGRLAVTFEHSGGRPPECHALALDGERLETLPVEAAGPGKWRLIIDTGKLAAGPSPYYELVFPPGS